MVYGLGLFRADSGYAAFLDHFNHKTPWHANLNILINENVRLNYYTSTKNDYSQVFCLFVSCFVRRSPPPPINPSYHTQTSDQWSHNWLSNETEACARCHDSGGGHSAKSQRNVLHPGDVIQYHSYPGIHNGDVVLLPVCLFEAVKILVLKSSSVRSYETSILTEGKIYFYTLVSKVTHSALWRGRA